MQLQIAIASISILFVSFVLNWYLKYLYQKTLKRLTQEGKDSVASMKAALELRNKRLGLLTFVVFIVMFLLQCFNIDDAVNKQKDNNMKNLEKRIEKIEKFLWGDGGGNAGTDPTRPPGGPTQAMSLQARVEDNTKRIVIVEKQVKEIYPDMKKVPAYT